MDDKQDERVYRNGSPGSVSHDGANLDTPGAPQSSSPGSGSHVSPYLMRTRRHSQDQLTGDAPEVPVVAETLEDNQDATARPSPQQASVESDSPRATEMASLMGAHDGENDVKTRQKPDSNWMIRKNGIASPSHIELQEIPTSVPLAQSEATSTLTIEQMPRDSVDPPWYDVESESRRASTDHANSVGTPARKRGRGKPPGGPFPAIARCSQRVLERLNDQRVLKVAVCIIAVLALILFLSLFPPSVKYLEYDKIALVRSRTTNMVGTQTYYPGCYVLLPDQEFVIFNSTAQFMHMKDVGVTTREPVEFKVSFALQYFIKPHELQLLFNKYEFDYEGVFKRMIVSSFKNRIVDFYLENLRLDRKQMESELHKVVKEKLGGNCCPDCCDSACVSRPVCSTCRPSGSCSHGYHADVKYFQLLQVSIPDSIMGRYSKQLMETVSAETELLKQNWTVETIKTEKIVQNINNQAELILANATAKASVITRAAEATADSVLQAATTQGLNSMYQKLGIVQPDHKMSLYLINALSHMDNLYAATDFQRKSAVVNPFKSN